MDVKEFMDNSHKNVNLGLLTDDKFKSQIKMIWYPMVVSFINDMIPFDIRWAFNDVEIKAFGSKKSYSLASKSATCSR